MQEEIQKESKEVYEVDLTLPVHSVSSSLIQMKALNKAT